MSVTALLVSHDGARWLPAVLAGLTGQTLPVDRVAVVDTTSRDDSVALVRDAPRQRRPRRGVRPPGPRRRPRLGELSRRRAPRSGPRRRPRRRGRRATSGSGSSTTTATPTPTALAELLAAAGEHPDAAILGPKLREWPSLRRLLEVGLTITGTGHRETGLERGEYDQGQHDAVREVLAVNTAGMLVKRHVLESLGGLDEELPIFGNDIDFGWRAALAGHRTLVVPQAVVFHAEAAHRGRPAYAADRAPHPLPGAPGRALHLAGQRVLAGVRLAVRPSLPRLAAAGAGLPRRPLGGRGARRARRRALGARSARARCSPRAASAPRRRAGEPPQRSRTTPAGAAVAALPPRPRLRHRPRVGRDQPGRRRRRAAAAREGPRHGHRRSRRAPRRGRLRPARTTRTPTSPTPASSPASSPTRSPSCSCSSACSRWLAAREAFGSITGGALSPVPAAAADWWQLHAATWLPLGTGTDVPAPAYVLPFALAPRSCSASTGAVVSGLMLLAVPIAAWGAWRLLKVVGHLVDPLGLPRWLVVWGALTYALVPVDLGRVGRGPLRHRRRRRAAAVGRPRRARLRRPRP